MRSIVMGSIIVIAALMAGASAGSAQGYNNRWCTDGGGIDEGAAMECSYYTREQCEASARGRGKYCLLNPDIGWRQQGNDPEPRRAGRQRNR